VPTIRYYKNETNYEINVSLFIDMGGNKFEVSSCQSGTHTVWALSGTDQSLDLTLAINKLIRR
jgi:hypothetical protein